MKIAILSGKGGTGKTTVSTNLFANLPGATLIDTDVEEPNSHLFLDCRNTSKDSIYKETPIIDNELCTKCGKCAEFCNFNALITTFKKVYVFEDLCHDCGGCALVCPENAISYEKKSIGDIITSNTFESQTFIYGNLDVGEVSGVRLIHHLRELTRDNELLLIDCPPGTACSTVAAVEGVDYAIIVAEPTPFGLSDMKMVVELLRNEEIPFGVVINKANLGSDQLYEYLANEKIDLIVEIPFSKTYAELYSAGKLISLYDDSFHDLMEHVISHLKEQVV